MDFGWTVQKKFQDAGKRNYINECCIGGDEILELFKFDLASEMKIDAEKIDIYQEDWGWALEFTKNEVSYFLAVSNCGEEENDKTLFNAYTEATKKEKIIFFSKTVDAEVELDEFSKFVAITAEKKWIGNQLIV